MVEVSAISVQAMQYSDCDHFMPDPNHVIPLKTDTSVVPEEHYFNLDEQFPIGSGFYVNAIVRSKAVTSIPLPELSMQKFAVKKNRIPAYFRHG